MNKISEKKIKEIIEDLRKYKSLNNKKHKANYYYQARQNIIDSEHPVELIKEFLDIYSQCKRNVTTTKEEVETDDRAITEVERDENGNIQYYTFEIFRKDSPILRGKLDRKEMETIYKLYSYYGSNLTQKIVSREFPCYTFVEFKRILRAFNIYKANSEFAPHQVEELTEEQLVNLHNQNKENNVLRRIEKDQLAEANKLINKLANKVQIYEDKLGIAKELLGYDLNTIVRDTVNTFSDDKTLVILLSDCHVGAFNEPNGYLKLENYNETEIYRRFNKILNSFDFKTYDNIIVINLGDSVDSYNKETTRGGHELPTIISNKEQSKLYLKIMFDFFKNLKEISESNIKYYCIGESNHDGDWGWLNNVVLAERLRELDIPAYISDNPIDYINIDNISLIYLHGKNNLDQFKGFPLTLNKQTESWFNDFFVDCDFNLKKSKIVIKGDLHQFAVTEGHNFQYISAPSLYGSSQYIVSNFGKTNWGVSYLTISNNNVQIGKISD